MSNRGLIMQQALMSGENDDSAFTRPQVLQKNSICYMKSHGKQEDLGLQSSQLYFTRRSAILTIQLELQNLQVWSSQLLQIYTHCFSCIMGRQLYELRTVSRAGYNRDKEAAQPQNESKIKAC